MTDRKYIECIDITEKALDMLDIKKFLHENEELSNIMWDIENYINFNNPKELINYMELYPDVFGQYLEIFNYMNDDEFAEYCKRRYKNLTIQEEIIERRWIKWS